MRSSIGYSEYRGWSEEGVIWFNELCSIVVEDRSSHNAMDSEEWVVLTLQQQKYGEPAQNGTGNTDNENWIHDSETSLERNAQIVNAMHSLMCDNNSTAITVSLIKYKLQTKMYALTTKRYTNVKEKYRGNKMYLYHKRYHSCNILGTS